MKLSDLLADRKKLAINVNGGTLNVVYRPNANTPEESSNLGSIAKQANELLEKEAQEDDPRVVLQGILMGSEMSELLVRQIVAYVESWDLVEDDETMIAITPERVSKLPDKILQAVVTAITTDNKPNPTKRKSSRATSSMAAN